MAMYHLSPQSTPVCSHGSRCLVLQPDDIIRFGAGDLHYDMRPGELQAYSGQLALMPDPGVIQPRSRLPGPRPPKQRLNPEFFSLLHR